MIKKYLPTAALLTGGLLLFRYLRGKAEAGKNLKYEPIGVYIDAARSAEANFYRLYYIVKIRLVNDYQQSVNINALNLEATSNGRPLGTLTSNIAFIVPSMGSKTVELSASVATTGILSTVIDAIQNGFNIPVKISGYINTDLGRLNINFTKQVGTQSISAPIDIVYSKKLYLIRKADGKYLQNSFTGPKWVGNREIASAWDDETQALKVAAFHNANVEVY
jgi:hypothetical protein